MFQADASEASAPHGIKVPAGRHLYAIVTGFALIYYPFGLGCFHALVPSTLTYLVLRYLRPQAVRLAWLINFTYLIGW